MAATGAAPADPNEGSMAATRTAGRRPSAPDPLAQLAALAARGTAAPRMRREVEDLVAARLANAGEDGRSALRDWLELVADQLAEGIAAGREAMDELDRDDRAAQAAGNRALAALEAAREAFGRARGAL